MNSQSIVEDPPVTAERTVTALLKHPALANAVLAGLQEKMLGPWEVWHHLSLCRRNRTGDLAGVVWPDNRGRTRARVFFKTGTLGEHRVDDPVEPVEPFTTEEEARQWVDTQLADAGYLLGEE